jgi:hypothetical protein
LRCEWAAARTKHYPGGKRLTMCRALAIKKIARRKWALGFSRTRAAATHSG